jgi:hypothetical protein
MPVMEREAAPTDSFAVKSTSAGAHDPLAHPDAVTRAPLRLLAT